MTSRTATVNGFRVVRLRLTRRRAAIAIGLAVPFVVSRTFGEFGNTILVQAAIAMIAIAGLHMLVHWTGQISLAHVALMGIGAFVTARANADFAIPLPGAMAFGVVGTMLASFAIGLPALRIRGLALAITTLAFSFAAVRWLYLQSWLVPESNGIPLRDTSLLGFDIAQSRELVIPLGLCLVAVITLTSIIGSSSLGRALRMVAHDEEVASSYGIDVPGHKLLAFLYAGACAGLAGAFMVVSIGQVGPLTFPVQNNILYLSVVLMGGPGPLFGSVQFAAGLAAFPILLSGLGRYVNLIGPLGMLLVVTVSPGGINGLHYSLLERLHRVSAARSRQSAEGHDQSTQGPDHDQSTHAPAHDQSTHAPLHDQSTHAPVRGGEKP